MIDRLAQPDHAVIDFFDFYAIWDYVFNVADICLTVGIALFVFDQLFLEPKRAEDHA
jgi:lipoprotein signal peptidase